PERARPAGHALEESGQAALRRRRRQAAVAMPPASRPPSASALGSGTAVTVTAAFALVISESRTVPSARTLSLLPLGSAVRTAVEPTERPVNVNVPRRIRLASAPEVEALTPPVVLKERTVAVAVVVFAPEELEVPNWNWPPLAVLFGVM